MVQEKCDTGQEKAVSLRGEEKTKSLGGRKRSLEVPGDEGLSRWPGCLAQVALLLQVPACPSPPEGLMLPGRTQS